MHTYIILLRAVNVSGKNIIKMADLKTALLQLGLNNITTYIQSGNLVLQSDFNKAATETLVHTCIQDSFGLDITVFVLTLQELINAHEHNPYKDKEPNKAYITFLHIKPNTQLIEQLHAIVWKDAFVNIWEQYCYFYLPNGMANAKVDNKIIESKMKVISTGRNLNTIQKLINLAQALS